MTLKLKPTNQQTPLPFSWAASSPPLSPKEIPTLPSPPTSWLSARDMKVFGAQPLNSVSVFGVSRCKDCDKPILRSSMSDHAEKCATIRSGGKKGAKAKLEMEGKDVYIDPKKGSKKRKASTEPDDPSLPAKKKTKPTTKVTKGRLKGPVDYDRQCGVINDKGLPCSRSLTCKSHAMGAKRSVQGRSRNFDELLLDWQRANKPNFVEPVKRESKAEKKEKREKERLEKKRLAGEAAIALGLDPLGAAVLKKSGVSSSKKVGKKAAAAAARLATEMGVEVPEDLDELDSEAEVDELVRVVKAAQSNGVLAVPLAVPCDAGSWFVQRRERARCCRDLFLGALGNGALPANRTNSFFG